MHPRLQAGADSAVRPACHRTYEPGAQWQLLLLPLPPMCGDNTPHEKRGSSGEQSEPGSLPAAGAAATAGRLHTSKAAALLLPGPLRLSCSADPPSKRVRAVVGELELSGSQQWRFALCRRVVVAGNKQQAAMRACCVCGPAAELALPANMAMQCCCLIVAQYG